MHGHLKSANLHKKIYLPAFKVFFLCLHPDTWRERSESADPLPLPGAEGGEGRRAHDSRDGSQVYRKPVLKSCFLKCLQGHLKHLSVSQTVHQAQCLANQVQLFYGTQKQETYRLVETFNHQPEDFKHMSVIAELEQSGLGSAGAPKIRR